MASAVVFARRLKRVTFELIETIFGVPALFTYNKIRKLIPKRLDLIAKPRVSSRNSVPTRVS